MNEQEKNDFIHLQLETLKLDKENREYLKKIDRRLRWSRNWTMFYWVIILGAAVLGYYYAIPYFQQVREDIIGTISPFIHSSSSQTSIKSQ